jgi:arylsulfatase A-like enzyme
MAERAVLGRVSSRRSSALAGMGLLLLLCAGGSSCWDAAEADADRVAGGSSAASTSNAEGAGTPDAVSGNSAARVAGAGGGAGPAAGAAGRVRNVVLISVDTLRQDRLEVYGYERPTSPNLAGLASRSAVFERAHAQASQTAPSHASLFTSEYPGTHGIVNVHGDHATCRTLPKGVVTLAEKMSGAGFETAAFVCGGNLTKRMDVNRGFGSWDERNEDIAQRVDALLAWLGQPREKPFLALLHSYQAHAPYVPPARLVPVFTDPAYAGPLRARLDRYLTLSPAEAWRGGVGEDYWAGMLQYSDADVAFLSDLYDAEIAYLDGELRRLLEALLLGPRAADTLVIVLSDHGEEFRDHGKFQHDQVYEELTRVPLLLHLPDALEKQGWKGRIAAEVSLIDVAPTVAELCGVAWKDAGWEGRSLVPLLDPATRAGAAARWGAPKFAELTVGPPHKVLSSVTFNGWKYIHIYQAEIGKTWEFLFHLVSDPKEARNLAEAQQPEAIEALGALRRILAERATADAQQRAQVGTPGSAEMDAEAQQKLKEIGY